MSRRIEILNGISEWVRKRVGPEAKNRGQDNEDGGDETDEDTDGESGKNDSPVCCSAASNSDLTVLDP